MRLKNILIRIFSQWELFIEKIYHIEHLNENNIFRYSIKKYKGHKIILSDGTVFNKGDKYIELHFDNLLILREFKNADTIKSSIILWKKVREGLKDISAYISQSENLKDVHVLMGISMFNKGIERAGFDVVDLFYLEEVFVNFYEGILLAIFSNDNVKRGKKMKAKRVLISVNKMNKLYGNGGLYDISK